MPHLGHDVAQRVFKLITTAVSVFLLIVLFYTLQYIFDMEFVCSCKPGLHYNGVLYMTAPPLILTLFVNLIEPFHQKRTFPSCSSLHHCCRCWSSYNNCCSHVLKLVIRYIGLGAVWSSAVLFDGDWYFCLQTNLNISQTGLPCKKDLTYNETRIKDAYKTESLDIGFYVICVLLSLWSLAEFRGAYCRMRCRKNCCSSDCCECSPYYVVVYEELLAEQVNNHLNKRLEEIATKRAEAICKPYLQVIEDHEQQLSNSGGGNRTVDDTVSESWIKISAFDFCLAESERQEDSLSKSSMSWFTWFNVSKFWRTPPQHVCTDA